MHLFDRTHPVLMRRFDVTDALAKRSAGRHELLVLATDHTEKDHP